MPKTYLAHLAKPLADQEADALRSGVELDDGPAQPAEVVFAGDRKTVRITVHEGRYHQVKRMFKAVGNNVVRLHRESFGALELGDLEPGAWRELTGKELALLKR